MRHKLLGFNSIFRFGLLISMMSVAVLFALPSQAQTAAPPAFGEETKGKPAITEGLASDSANDEVDSAQSTSRSQSGKGDKQANSFADNVLGQAQFKESRRENGQVYRIELQHSAGSKQVIEENDSDGQLTTDDNGLDDVPNLPKWRLGSW